MEFVHLSWEIVCFHFFCMNFSEIYISDRILYDNALTDKSSNYTVSPGASFTFDIDHYIFSQTSNSMVELITGYDNVQFEVLLKHGNNAGGIIISESSLNFSPGVGLYNNASNTTYLGLFPWQNVKSQNNVTNNNDYYRYILIISGSSISARIENTNGNILFSGTTSKSLSENHFNLFSPANTVYIKEISIKPL